jgi:hypothetical protein
LPGAAMLPPAIATTAAELCSSDIRPTSIGLLSDFRRTFVRFPSDVRRTFVQLPSDYPTSCLRHYCCHF